MMGEFETNVATTASSQQSRASKESSEIHLSISVSPPRTFIFTRYCGIADAFYAIFYFCSHRKVAT